MNTTMWNTEGPSFKWVSGCDTWNAWSYIGLQCFCPALYTWIKQNCAHSLFLTHHDFLNHYLLSVNQTSYKTCFSSLICYLKVYKPHWAMSHFCYKPLWAWQRTDWPSEIGNLIENHEAACNLHLVCSVKARLMVKRTSTKHFYSLNSPRKDCLIIKHPFYNLLPTFIVKGGGNALHK